MPKLRLIFPWISTSYALLLASYFYIVSDPELAQSFQLDQAATDPHIRFMALIALFVLFAIDLVLFQKRQIRHNREIEKYRDHFNEVVRAKNALQSKAHKYSDHADKLKLFISDRLLEYIEYDEKFLHFKNIAAEVRHNGVVCYDKVNSALALGLGQASEENRKQFEEAIHSMSYLWDLLDLSTTDNIALYIANKLYEAEEHYYQSLLQSEPQHSPFQPTFSARSAVYRSLQGFVDGNDGKLPPLNGEEDIFLYSDATFWVSLARSGTLLGNENYIVLMCENLINNALYYSDKKQFRGGDTKIEVSLESDDRLAIFSCYNRGPHIDDAARQQIFQLGYSTRRSKDHRGKGLGLYFVNEIVKGYEGRIDVTNIANQPDTYVLRFELGNGETMTHIVETILDEKERLQCRAGGDEKAARQISFNIDDEIAGIEVAVQSRGKTYVVEDLGTLTNTPFTDPLHPARPQWALELKTQNRRNKITFRPLDISGVLFRVELPTAQSRLDSTYHEENATLVDASEALDETVAEIEPFVK